VNLQPWLFRPTKKAAAHETTMALLCLSPSATGDRPALQHRQALTEDRLVSQGATARRRALLWSAAT